MLVESNEEEECLSRANSVSKVHPERGLETGVEDETRRSTT